MKILVLNNNVDTLDYITEVVVGTLGYCRPVIGIAPSVYELGIMLFGNPTEVKTDLIIYSSSDNNETIKITDIINKYKSVLNPSLKILNIPTDATISEMEVMLEDLYADSEPLTEHASISNDLDTVSDILDIISYLDDICITYSTDKNTLHKIVPRGSIIDIDNVVVLDSLIANLIVKLNSFKECSTMYCCGGHENDHDAYIMFTEDTEISMLVSIIELCGIYSACEDEIPNIGQSIKLEVTNSIIEEKNVNYVIRFDCNYITRKQRHELFNYIIKEL